MKKLYLAASIVTAMAAMNTQAAEVFKKGSDSVDIGGYANLMFIQSDGSDQIDLADNSSRINFAFNKGLKSGWSAQAKYEFGLSKAYAPNKFVLGANSITKSTSNPLSSRLAYVGLMHDKYGKVILGKNWGVYHSVAGVADAPQKFGSSPCSYEMGDGGIPGTGRAEKVLQYHNAIGPVSLGLQVQPYKSDITTDGTGLNYKGQNYTHVQYDMGYGLSLKYNIMDVVEIGVAYNAHNLQLGKSTDIDDDDNRKLDAAETLQSTAMSASIQYGDHGSDGFFFGFVYASAKEHMAVPSHKAFKTLPGPNAESPLGGVLVPEVTSMNAAISYKVNDLTPMVGYYTHEYKSTKDRPVFAGLSAKDDTKLTKTVLVVGLSYDWTDDLMFYLEAGIDMSGNDEKDYDAVPTANAKDFIEEFEADGTGYALGMKYVF